MNERLEQLHPYPFERMNALKETLSVRANAPHIALSLGEPKHPAADFLVTALIDEATMVRGVGTYPPTKGTDGLRNAIAEWLTDRFGLARPGVDPARHVLPVNGTREALFAFAQAVVPASPAQRPAVLLPNPFYQIYEGAAILAGAEPVYVPCHEENGFLPDFSGIPDDLWARTALVYLCSPGNPTGAVMSAEALGALIDRADEHDFVIAADECYSEIYPADGVPPTGLLAVAAARGRADFDRCIVFHSLSKRSNLPGLRSGFAAGDPAVLERFLLYRTYHGSAMPVQVADVSALAWRDEAHVQANRVVYDRKFEAVTPILQSVLDVARPAASFYLWPKLPIDALDFTQRLFVEEHVTVLPGPFLARAGLDGRNPGDGRVRIALVATLEETVEAAERIQRFVSRL